LRPDLRIIVRLFDADLAERLERALGEYHSRSVSALAAPAFAAAAVSRTVLATIPMGHGRLLVVASVPVARGSHGDGSTVAVEERAACDVEAGGARILAVVRDGRPMWAPAADTRLAAGEELVLVARRRALVVAMARAGDRVGGRPPVPGPPGAS
jgi:Trk K+ transport system NAD-binding subunit